MMYESKRFSVPGSAGAASTCEKVGHCGPDVRGKCLRCAEKMQPAAANLASQRPQEALQGPNLPESVVGPQRLKRSIATRAAESAEERAIARG